mmetsp:Transcript_9407/g.17726  ORF Transcript_9407/g.17726 Transcript_9407/m.17726 type:complete len:419 (-) Transcript_9407:53-1309(-)|eukprot:CAMPEP_0176486020 /NCGR_PEP_ID=MMETSP0200_2-20121128/5347_1 /TAXON_ID=947934 /ORGANISM="Chaetoceros sp., Strain GSL56" /LENGTH=418 /DNA_ID=CAMNT_0017882697 /DNA_START=166 /DNA_END=1422 /DNA_ORIENTATION=-
MISSLAAHRLTTSAIRGRTSIIPLSQRLNALQITTRSSSAGIVVRRQREQQCDVLSTSIPPGIKTFSTRPQQTIQNNEALLYIPPNLKIDPKISIAPFAGLEKISPIPTGSISPSRDNQEKSSKTTEPPMETQAAIDNSNESANDYLENTEDEVDDDGEEAGVYYSLSNKPEPVYAIPLPQRLHAPILDFVSSSEAGTIHLSENVFGLDPIRTDILHRCVVYQRNKKRGRRNGGAKTKTIGEVSGSGKKMRNQKGGGVARAGHKRPAHWRGGAKAHGPKGSVQNYETKLNKKVRKLGLRMALSQKLKEGNLILVNSFSDVGTYKTKIIAEKMQSLAGIGGKYGTSAYILDHVEDQMDENGEVVVTSLDGCDIHLKVGCQNILRTKVTNQQNLNVYDILKHEKLVMSLSALEQVEQRYR